MAQKIFLSLVKEFFQSPRIISPEALVRVSRTGTFIVDVGAWGHAPRHRSVATLFTCASSSA